MVNVWCTCPTRCKGGRMVTPRTRAIHEKLIYERERLQVLRQHFPERYPPPPDPPRRRRRRIDDDDTQGISGKKARGSDGQGSATQIQPVRRNRGDYSSRLTKTDIVTSSLKLATIAEGVLRMSTSRTNTLPMIALQKNTPRTNKLQMNVLQMSTPQTNVPRAHGMVAETNEVRYPVSVHPHCSLMPV